MKNDNYDHFAETFAKSRKNMAWGELDAILADISENNFTKILDVGSGSGRFLEFYKKYFEKFPEYYLGVDNSEKIIWEAKKSFPEADFLVAEMSEIDKFFLKNFYKKTEKFDAIVFLASFHHICDENIREKILQNMYEILAENGRIYLTNWNLRGQEKYQKNEASPWEFFIKIGEFERYYHGFTLDELEKIFQKNNFKIIKNEIFEGRRNFLSILEK